MGKKLLLIICFICFSAIILFLLTNFKKDINPISGWKTVNNIDYSIKYSPDWMMSDKSDDGGVIYLSNFKTNTCTDEKGNPINVLKNTICVAISVSQQVSNLENMSIAQYLNRQFGRYDSESKDYETIVFEEEVISGHQAYKIKVNNTLNYVIRQKNTLFQISMAPEDSQLADQFKLMLSTLQLFATQ